LVDNLPKWWWWWWWGLGLAVTGFRASWLDQNLSIARELVVLNTFPEGNMQKTTALVALCRCIWQRASCVGLCMLGRCTFKAGMV
jgi:hypothetical protein